MGWFYAKKKHGKGLFHSDYKSDDYLQLEQKKQAKDREQKQKEREQYEKDISQSMNIANKGRDKRIC